MKYFSKQLVKMDPVTRRPIKPFGDEFNSMMCEANLGAFHAPHEPCCARPGCHTTVPCQAKKCYVHDSYMFTAAVANK